MVGKKKNVDGNEVAVHILLFVIHSVSRLNTVFMILSSLTHTWDGPKRVSEITRSRYELEDRGA